MFFNIFLFCLKVYSETLNVSEDGVEFEIFTIISTDSLLAYERKYYLQVYLGNFSYKIV